jgi:hypothetical protein
MGRNTALCGETQYRWGRHHGDVIYRSRGDRLSSRQSEESRYRLARKGCSVEGGAVAAVVLRYRSRVEERGTTEQVFQDLKQKWRFETSLLNSVKKRVMNQHYQSIIGLGFLAVPLILRELQQEPDHWFWALQAITREDPAEVEADFNQMRDCWLTWGRDRGYL